MGRAVGILIAALLPANAPAMPTTPAAPKPVRFTVVASGDFLIHQPVWSRALSLGHGRRYDFAPLFRAIRPVIRAADLAICHVETPLQRGAPQGYPVFRTPPDLAKAIKSTGWDACSTASNHTLDLGQGGIDSTIRTLNRAGLRHAGSYRSARARLRPTIVAVKGVKVAFLSYTQVSNGQIAPHPWSVNVATAPRILAEARRARRRGAKVVIVGIHWGDEYVARPSPAQRALARTLTASKSIDAIVGQHVHVVQPIRMLHGKPVVYGEGNLVSNQSAACCPTPTQDGIIARLTFEVKGAHVRVTHVRAIPTWVRHPDYLVLPVRRALRYDRADRGALLASLRRTRAIVGRYAR